MDSEPLVSILIPNYNKAPYLRETLDSISAQTYTNWECIIVDDYSTDSSWDILKEYTQFDKRFSVHHRPIHLSKGGNAARNYAFELSKGEFVNWFDSDDLMNEGFLKEKVESLISEPSLDFVNSDLRIFDYNISDSSKYKSLDLSVSHSNFALQALIGEFWIQTSLPLFRKSFLNKFSLFNNGLLRSQEAEFFNRILLSNPSFRFVATSICYWRQNSNSKTSQFIFASNQEKSILSFPAHYLILNEYLNKRSLDEVSIGYFNKLINIHLRFLPIFSTYYFTLVGFIYFKYKQFPMDYPVKILARRILKIEDWE